MRLKVMILGAAIAGLISACSDQPQPDSIESPSSAQSDAQSAPDGIPRKQGLKPILPEIGLRPEVAPRRPARPAERHVRLGVPPQDAPVYQATTLPPRKPVLIHQSQASVPTQSASTSGSAPPRPNPTAGLFGPAAPSPTGGAPAPGGSTSPVPFSSPPTSAGVSMPPAQKLGFAECAKRLQGAVKGVPGARLVQNDANGYAVEINTPNGVQRAACDPRSNTVTLSQQ